MIGCDGVTERVGLNKDQMRFLQNTTARQKRLPIEDCRRKQQIDRPHKLNQGFSGAADTEKRHAAGYQEMREGGCLGLLKERASRGHPMQDRQVRQAIEGRGGYPTKPRSLAQSRAGRGRRAPCDGTSSRVTIRSFSEYVR